MKVLLCRPPLNRFLFNPLPWPPLPPSLPLPDLKVLWRLPRSCLEDAHCVTQRLQGVGKVGENVTRCEKDKQTGSR